MNPQTRVAVVTGASSGIGKSAAKALARQGWRVIGVGRDAARCAAAEAELRAAASAANVEMIRADLSLLADAARAAGDIAARTDRIDVLINNAGGVGSQMLMRSEEHTSELQSLMRISYAVFCLKKKTLRRKSVHDTVRKAVID